MTDSKLINSNISIRCDDNVAPTPAPVAATCNPLYVITCILIIMIQNFLSFSQLFSSWATIPLDKTKIVLYVYGSQDTEIGVHFELLTGPIIQCVIFLINLVFLVKSIFTPPIPLMKKTAHVFIMSSIILIAGILTQYYWQKVFSLYYYDTNMQADLGMVSSGLLTGFSVSACVVSFCTLVYDQLTYNMQQPITTF
jgi:hypothetical protein